MTRGDSLAQTIEATQRSLEERLHEAVGAHPDPDRPRDNYRVTDAFTAATSRHLAAIEAVLLARVRHAVPAGDELVREYLHVARSLEHTLALVKGRLYGEAHAIHLEQSDLWERVRAQLTQHNHLERRLVAMLIQHDDPAKLDGLARRVFDAEAHGPTRPHPLSPHTGLRGLVARRFWALADRIWDSAEGRVIPAPVKPAPHRHDSLIGQYLVADPKFDADATIMQRHRRHHDEAG